MPYAQRPYVPARDPLAAIPPSRHPFQFWVMFALVLSGVGNFIASGSPAVAGVVDPFYHKLWALTLMIGGTCGILGAFWRDRITGLLLERVGLSAIGVSCPLYAVMFVAQVGLAASAVGGTITFSVGIASLWRIVHVNRELRVLRQFIHQAGMR